MSETATQVLPARPGNKSLRWRRSELCSSDAYALARWHLTRTVSNKLKRFLKKNLCVSTEDFVQDAMLWLCKFPPPHEYSLSTVVGHAVRWVLCRKLEWLQHCGRIPDRIPGSIDGLDVSYEHEFSDNVLLAEALDKALGLLSHKRRVAVTSLFGIGCEPKTKTEIATMLRVSRERARQLCECGIEDLGRYEARGILRGFSDEPPPQAKREVKWRPVVRNATHESNGLIPEAVEAEVKAEETAIAYHERESKLAELMAAAKDLAGFIAQGNEEQ